MISHATRVPAVAEAAARRRRPRSTRDRHDPVSPVTPFCANLSVQIHNITCALFRVGLAGHRPYFNPTKLSFPKVEGQHARRAAGLSSVYNPVLSIYTCFPLRMSTTSDVDEFQSCDEKSGEKSGGEGSAASSLASDLHWRLKRPRPTQIRGKAWALRGDISIHINSISDCKGGYVVDEHVQMLKTHLAAALGAKFENLFQKMLENISVSSAGGANGCKLF
jgi:hypothetical protein